MSGHIQAIFSGLAKPAARCPGQNGSSVWSSVSTSPEMLSCSWAATGYTPNSLIPAELTWNEAVQSAVPPGFTLAGMINGVPGASRPLSELWLRKESMPSRVVNGVDDVYSCTASPACVWPVPLLTVPVTVTVLPGSAYCGFVELMVTATRPVPAWSAGLASAGLGSASSAEAVAAGMASAAARDRVRRQTFAASKPCTPRMLLPFAPDRCGR